MIDPHVAIMFAVLLAGALLYSAVRRVQCGVTSHIDALVDELGCTVSRIEEFYAAAEQMIGRVADPVDRKFTAICDRIDTVEDAIAELSISQSVNVRKLESRLEKLTAAVEDIPYPLSPGPVSLDPVIERLGLIEKELVGITEIMNRRSSSGQPIITRHKLAPDS